MKNARAPGPPFWTARDAGGRKDPGGLTPVRMPDPGACRERRAPALLHRAQPGVFGGHRVDGGRGVERDVDGSGPAGAEADLDRLWGADPAEPDPVPKPGGCLLGPEQGCPRRPGSPGPRGGRPGRLDWGWCSVPAGFALRRPSRLRSTNRRTTNAVTFRPSAITGPSCGCFREARRRVGCAEAFRYSAWVLTVWSAPSWGG
jgi:hypothetical protein